jgi:hypothetical protein
VFGQRRRNGRDVIHIIVDIRGFGSKYRYKVGWLEMVFICWRIIACVRCLDFGSGSRFCVE